jgi:hypothetical protein
MTIDKHGKMKQPRIFFWQKRNTIDNVVSVLDKMIPELDQLSIQHNANVITLNDAIATLQRSIEFNTKERDRAEAIKANLASLLVCK